MTKHRSVWKYCLLAFSTILVIIWGQGTLSARGENPGFLPPTIQCHSNSENYGACLTQKGHELFNRGQAQKALETWKEAEMAYRESGNQEGIQGSQINQGMGLQALGQSRRGCFTLISALGLTYENNELCKQWNELDLERAEDEQGNVVYVERSKEQQQVSLKEELQKLDISQIQAIGLRNLGEVLRAIGKLDESETILQTSLEMFDGLHHLPLAERSATLLSLANTQRALYHRQVEIFERTNKSSDLSTSIEKAQGALTDYDESANVAKDISETNIFWVQAKLNQLSFLLEYKNWLKQVPSPPDELSEETSKADMALPALVQELLDKDLSLFSDLLPLQAIDARLNLANSLATESDKLSLAIEYAAQALTQAEAIADPRSISYAWGTLGYLHEQKKDLNLARNYTEQAVNLSQAIQAWDIAYEWQYQLGRIHEQNGDIKEAIAAYEVAIDSLDRVRQDLLSINSDLRFSFREKFKPIYEDLIWALLHKVTPEREDLEQDNLKKVTEAIGKFQEAELENYLGCTDTITDPPESGDRQTNFGFGKELQERPAAIIYTTVLEKHNTLEVIVKLPGHESGKEYYYNSQKNRHNWAEVKKDVKALQNILQSKDFSEKKDEEFITKNIFTYSHNLYNVLIEKNKANWPENGTLVFVLDSLLNNIPMGLLQENPDRYLLEDYSIALTLGGRQPQPQALDLNKSSALIAGATEWKDARTRNLDPLPNITDELNEIEKLTIAGSRLDNQKFTRNKFQNQVTNLPVQIIHIATHAKFSSDPDLTTIEAYDQAINLKQLKNLLQSKTQSSLHKIELLVLSACQTAQGDKRASLGLAGVAVQAGARSTVASFWNVNDPSTPLFMKMFYERLKEGDSKAEALRRAQLDLLHNTRYKNLYYWSGFVLTGSWI